MPGSAAPARGAAGAASPAVARGRPRRSCRRQPGRLGSVGWRWLRVGLAAEAALDAFAAAAELSERLNVIRVPRPFKRVLSMPAERYDDLWTAAKAMYKTEPVVADGGEVVIYAPHITEVS